MTKFSEVFMSNEPRQMAVKADVSRAVSVVVIRKLTSWSPRARQTEERDDFRNVGFYGHLTLFTVCEDFIEKWYELRETKKKSRPT
jgi:hypothetical protein